MARRLQASHSARSDFRGSAVSSIASHVSAAATTASLRQQQIAGSAQDRDKDPFAALLEAIAAAADAANASAATAQNGQPGVENDKTAAKTANFGLAAEANTA